MGIVEQSFSSGEVIIREGDIGNSFFRILDGNVGVYSDYGKKEQFRIAIIDIAPTAGGTLAGI